jgi:hypothetical protein
MRLLLSLLTFSASIFAAAADEPKAGSVSPKGTPLKAELQSKETKFTLDLGGLSPEDYLKQLDEAAKGKVKPPKGPVVDFTLVLTNTSDKAIQVWKSGDPVTIEFTLTGPGVKEIAPPIAMTMEFRIPMSVELAAGKTLEFPIKNLMGGMRGISKSTYWTKPGEYQLAAMVKTGVSPPPEGAKKQEGFGIVTVTSAPIKLTVEAAK